MQKPTDFRGLLITAVIAVAIGVAAYAIARNDTWGDGGSGLPQAFKFDVGDLATVDPTLIQFKQTAEIPLNLKSVRAIATGPAGTIYVAGDQAVHSFQPDASEEAVIELDGEPTCLAVGGADHSKPGRLYVGVGRQVKLFDPDGQAAGTWECFESNATLTSIAVAKQDVFVADAANKIVIRCDTSGEVAGRIGTPDPDREMPGFVVPSAQFDVAVSGDELLHVVNPGARRIESFTFEGDLEVFWGEESAAIEGFFGCCNPSQFALLPNGKFVTSEKGIPRVKIYSDAGEFESVVAGPQQLDVAKSEIGDPRANRGQTVFDIATDGQGRVLVLDPKKKIVRIFLPLEMTETADAG